MNCKGHVKIVSLDIVCPPTFIVKPDHQTHLNLASTEPAEGRRLFNENPMRKAAGDMPKYTSTKISDGIYKKRR